MDHTVKSNGFNETTWNTQTRNLRKLSRLLLQDLEKVESLFCFDLKSSIDLFDEVRRFEMNLITTALLHTGGSQRRSAALLGISPSNLSYKMKNYGITFRRPGRHRP
jgi:DNA-binding NtrC family response regulator